MTNTIDFSRIPARHDAINLRLEEWARWVKEKPHAWACQPMFRYAKSNARQWEVDPHIQIEINTLAAHEIERVVCFLPDKHRTALRWAYVFNTVPLYLVRKELGLTRDALCKMIDDARDMTINRLKQRIVER